MRCALCPNKHRCIRPDGPADAEILFVGEAPGVTEERQDRVFVGKTGDEVNRHYLPLAGLRRERVRFTNAIRCLPVSARGKVDLNNAKDKALLESCAACHLYPLIERQPPRVIVALGAFACAALNPEIDLELDHGLPCDSPWEIPVFPMFHPAQGLHEPKRMLLIRNDWIRLKQYLAGKWQRRVDAYPNPDYREAVPDDILDLRPDQPLACDTEFSQRGPYCLTYSQVAGTGRLIRAEDTNLLQVFQQQLDMWHAPILFHSWLADRPVTQDMGLTFPESRIVDTLAWVFHLGNLPQGLKALAYRELGMTMQSWEDLVTPYSAELAMAYFGQAYTEGPWPKPEEQVVRDAEGKFRLYKPQSLSTKLKRFFSDMKRGLVKDPFQAWENWEAHHAEVVEKCGEWPGRDIRHVPFQQVVGYACRDSDALLRLYYILLQMRARVRKYPQDKWRAA